jgi:hypothetical protein
VTRRTSLIAVAILAIALAVRLIQVETTSYAARFDARSYLSLAGEIAHSGGYSLRDTGAGGTRGRAPTSPRRSRTSWRSRT